MLYHCIFYLFLQSFTDAFRKVILYFIHFYWWISNVPVWLDKCCLNIEKWFMLVSDISCCLLLQHYMFCHIGLRHIEKPTEVIKHFLNLSSCSWTQSCERAGDENTKKQPICWTDKSINGLFLFVLDPWDEFGKTCVMWKLDILLMSVVKGERWKRPVGSVQLVVSLCDDDQWAALLFRLWSAVFSGFRCPRLFTKDVLARWL